MQPRCTLRLLFTTSLAARWGRHFALDGPVDRPPTSAYRGANHEYTLSLLLARHFATAYDATLPPCGPTRGALPRLLALAQPPTLSALPRCALARDLCALPPCRRALARDLRATKEVLQRIQPAVNVGHIAQRLFVRILLLRASPQPCAGRGQRSRGAELTQTSRGSPPVFPGCLALKLVLLDGTRVAHALLLPFGHVSTGAGPAARGPRHRGKPWPLCVAILGILLRRVEGHRDTLPVVYIV
eukprot:scaffold19245_cov118-Isochrysis_galbana.AAC.6